jgi:hypothetical protein
MAKRTRYNPERRTWRGISYKKEYKIISHLRLRSADRADRKAV